MNITHISQQRVHDLVCRTLLPLLPAKKYKIFFFGSRVAGTQASRSDIDIGILGRRPVPSATMLNLRDALDELPILYPMEVVDMATVSATFKKNAMQHVELIN